MLGKKKKKISNVFPKYLMNNLRTSTRIILVPKRIIITIATIIIYSIARIPELSVKA